MLVGDMKRKDTNSYKKILFSLMKQNMNGLAAVQYLRMLSEISKDLECDAPETKVNVIKFRNLSTTLIDK